MLRRRGESLSRAIAGAVHWPCSEASEQPLLASTGSLHSTTVLSVQHQGKMLTFISHPSGELGLTSVLDKPHSASVLKHCCRRWYNEEEERKEERRRTAAHASCWTNAGQKNKDVCKARSPQPGSVPTRLCDLRKGRFYLEN